MRDSEDRFEPADALARHFANELHDGPVQWMVGAKMQAESIRRVVAEGREVPIARIDELINSLIRGLAESRRLMRGLRGPDLIDGFWHQELEQDLRHSSATVEPADVNLQFELAANSEPLPPPVAASAYRLLREATWNALKYAQAKHIKLSAQIAGDQLVLAVEDDGKGFDANKTKPGSHGVAGLKDRARAIGGRAELETAIGQGTTWRFEIPVAR